MGIFSCFFSSADFIFKSTCLNFFKNTIKVSHSFDLDQGRRFVVLIGVQTDISRRRWVTKRLCNGCCNFCRDNYCGGCNAEIRGPADNLLTEEDCK